MAELLKARASVRTALPDGKMALSIAKSSGRAEVVTLLQRA
jgi:hypothetical protein